MALLGALLLATPVAARLGGGSSGTVAGVDARTLFDRTHVIGASASAGFGVRPPLPSGHQGRAQPISLTRIAQAAKAQPGAVTGNATSLFFMSPVETGTKQIDAALAQQAKPTIVLAVDYLFWFVYGARDADRQPISNEAQRMALLEVGLANVDRLAKAGVPVVVGDLPDMSAAVGTMLSKSQMPQLETLRQANERIKNWAAQQPLVTVVPLARLVEQLNGSDPFTAGNRVWSAKGDGPLIQADHLHPTFVGSVALIACAEQAACTHFRGSDSPGLQVQVFEHDPAKVAAVIRTQIEEELAKRAQGNAPTPAEPKQPAGR
jgi:hypothetical protein